MTSPQTLADLQHPGDGGTILSVDGDDAVAVRIMEMGLTDGEEIRLLGKAPLGDPLEFQIRGYRLSLRKTEAARVRIEPQTSPAETAH